MRKDDRDNLETFLGPEILRGARSGPKRVLDSRDLFGNDKVVLIKHQDQFYRLMITRQDKLILNK